MDQHAYWVGLSLVPGIGPAKFRRLVEQLGSPEAAWKARPALLAEAGLDRRAIDSLASTRSRVDLEREMEKLRRLEVRLLTLEDPEYPQRLQNIADPPPVLYLKGDLLPSDDPAVAIVGTRRPTVYGRQAAELFAKGLAENGVTGWRQLSAPEPDHIGSLGHHPGGGGGRHQRGAHHRRVRPGARQGGLRRAGQHLQPG